MANVTAKMKLLFCLLLFSMNSFAVEWEILPEKSQLTFTATQNNSPVTGEFKKFSGDIHFTPDQLIRSYVKIIVTMNSVTTSFKDIADALKTAEWFDVASYPQAVFIADHFKETGKNAFDAQGHLTLRNKTMPLDVHFILKKYTNDEAIVTGYADLKRTDYEVGKGEWVSTKEVKDEVSVNFTVTAINKKDSPAQTIE